MPFRKVVVQGAHHYTRHNPRAKAKTDSIAAKRGKGRARAANVIRVRPTDIRCAPETRLVTPPKKAGPGRPRGSRRPKAAELLFAHEWAKKAEWCNVTCATGADGQPRTARLAWFRVRATVKAGKATDETGWLISKNERTN